jgi:hypothetical protein
MPPQSITPAKRVADLSRIPPRSSLQFTERFSRQGLQAFRKVGDPLADAVVAELHRTKGLTNIRDLLGVVQERAKQSPSNIYRDFLRECEETPAWVNAAQIARGQQVLAAYSSVMGPSLLAGSLVGGAMFSSAAAITLMAGNFSYDPSRRVTETALIISHLMFPGELMKATGKARLALIRVRLLHAGLRHWLPASGRYKRTVEIPINQHDLAITLALFGYVNLRSLVLMSVHMTREEIDAYMHMWKYAGYLLGIEGQLLPDSLEDQEEFFLASCIAEAHPESILPASKGVLDAIAKDAYHATYGFVPYDIAQTSLHQLTRFLSGNEYCTGMEIEDLGENHWSIRLARGLGIVTSVTTHYLPFGEPLVRNWNLFMTRRMIERHEAQAGKLAQGINVAPDGFQALPAKL